MKAAHMLLTTKEVKCKMKYEPNQNCVSRNISDTRSLHRNRTKRFQLQKQVRVYIRILVTMLVMHLYKQDTYILTLADNNFKQKSCPAPATQAPR
jgi:hypothetical protein